jgi:flagellar biosynthetic protein FliQ
MDAQAAVDLFRESVYTALLITIPVLLAGSIVGLLIGLFQALTQIHEQTIAIVVKILVMVSAIAFLMPWMTIEMMDFAVDLFKNIPEQMIYQPE